MVYYNQMEEAPFDPIAKVKNDARKFKTIVFLLAIDTVLIFAVIIILILKS